MRQLLSQFAGATEATLDALAWFVDRTKLFFAVMLVAPLLAVAITTLLFYDLRTWARPAIEPWFYTTVLMLPAWITACVWVECSRTPLAFHIGRAMRAAPPFIAGALLVTGVLLVLHGKL